MTETAPHSKPPAIWARVDGLSRRPAGVAALLGVACLSVLVALVGWFLGAAGLTAVEPEGVFVDCGPALFNRPDPLPDAACASAYFPLPAASVVFIVVGFVGAILCVALLARRATLNARPT